MTNPEQLLRQFISEDRDGGNADPLAYLARVQGPEREQLEALIDGYLARAPRRRFDAAAFAGSPAARVTESIDRALLGDSGRWPTLLPRLRHRAQLRRSEIVARLAASLGAAGQEQKVARYYHEMELGTLPARGVSERVLSALGEIVGESATTLRQAGASLIEASSPAPDAPATFARVASPNPDFSEASHPADALDGPAPLDEVDRLFTGGA